ncbi:MAG TPA: Xaa-Pro peptidase family protein [Candidatus Acidoferrum sp.]|nr:Xaa-Pro peptidase family protein [Candidatus Acidoferrum sp.]
MQQNQGDTSLPDFFMTADYLKRRKTVAAQMKSRGLDGLLVTNRANWFYLSGFTGESGGMIVTVDTTILITDARFSLQAKQETHGVKIQLQKGLLYPALGQFLRREKLGKVGFDPRQLTVAECQAVRKGAGTNCKTVEAQGIVEGLRRRKDAGELAVMRKAAVLADAVMERAIKMLRPGMRESEVAAEIEYHMHKLGASGPAFETIVASGTRAALPHARPTAKRLRKNELVVLDLGVILGNYCSDMTRTVCLGRAPGRVRSWYTAVQEAQAAGVAAVQAGASCGQVDAATREVLKKSRLEQYFVHSTGHGLGLEVHEEPRVARGQEFRLESGNVITVEPGVYVEGIGGIRIEDDVAVSAKGSEVLTRLKRDLIEL